MLELPVPAHPCQYSPTGAFLLSLLSSPTPEQSRVQTQHKSTKALVSLYKHFCHPICCDRCTSTTLAQNVEVTSKAREAPPWTLPFHWSLGQNVGMCPPSHHKNSNFVASQALQVLNQNILTGECLLLTASQTKTGIKPYKLPSDCFNVTC